MPAQKNAHAAPAPVAPAPVVPPTTAPTTPPTVAAAPAAAPAPAKPKKPKKAIRVPAPIILQDAIAAAAKEKGKSPAVWARDFLAHALNVTLPPTASRTRTVYGSKDEKKAAQKARRVSRATLVKKLLADHEAMLAKAAAAPEVAPTAAA